MEYLFYVGCTGSFDERGKKVTAAMVKLLNQAGVSCSRILGAEEKCCGETARRIGNEYLFQSMATELAETINGYGIQKMHHRLPRLQLPEERVPPIRRQLGGLPSHRVSGPAG